MIYQFCAQANCADGSQSTNGLLMDASGNLFGVTFGGGGSSSGGVIFELSPHRRSWTETVLHDFCSEANCPDGGNPESPLGFDASGNLVGTTASGGSRGHGTVFSLAPGNGQYSLLYSFCLRTNCTDGSDPIGRIAIDAAGNIFGTTIAGGDPNFSRGVLYELSAGSLTVLHTFCASGDCSDGEWPVGGVLLDPSQNLFGTTSEGGEFNQGAAWELTP